MHAYYNLKWTTNNNFFSFLHFLSFSSSSSSTPHSYTFIIFINLETHSLYFIKNDKPQILKPSPIDLLKNIKNIKVSNQKQNQITKWAKINQKYILFNQKSTPFSLIFQRFSLFLYLILKIDFFVVIMSL